MDSETEVFMWITVVSIESISLQYSAAEGWLHFVWYRAALEYLLDMVPGLSFRVDMAQKCRWGTRRC